jgi:hypothetical protein
MQMITTDEFIKSTECPPDFPDLNPLDFSCLEET